MPLAMKLSGRGRGSQAPDMQASLDTGATLSTWASSVMESLCLRFVVLSMQCSPTDAVDLGARWAPGPLGPSSLLIMSLISTAFLHEH